MNLKILFYTLFFLSVLTISLKAQNPPAAKAQSKAIVLKGGTFHIGTGEVLENASIRFENGLITSIGASVDEANAEVISCTGKHIYPGLILPNSVLGLVEVSAVRATNDYAEVGEYNPNVRALIAYNTDSEVIPTTRSNGVLLVQTTPRYSTIAGTSSVMELDGWNWEDAVLRKDDGIHFNSIPMNKYNFFAGTSTKNEDRSKQMAELENFFQEALAYSQTTASTKNLKFEAMKGLFDGSKTFFVHASDAKEIVESIQFAKKHTVKKIVLVGGEESLDVADFLRDNNIPVLLERVHRLPSNADEDVFLPYKLPSLLKKQGILVGLCYDSEEPMGSRNLPFLAGTSVAYGLTKEEALMTVTSNTAKILGIEDKVGTLEKGKHATLVVSAGDLLDMRSNLVEKAYIRGKLIDLDDKQKRLYKMYKEKYGK